MSLSNQTLRLVEEIEAEASASSGLLSTLASTLAVNPAEIDQKIGELQEEITSLNAEIEALRRRDETVKFYMHRLDEEMRLAARLQQDFLPKSLPQVGRVHFHTLFRPAGYVSGDLYDVMRLDEKHVGFYMADAVGHGMPAALLTMFIKNALVTKEIGPAGYRLLTPGETIAKLNEVLLSQHLSYATFATAIYGTINAETLEVTLARGGHPNPILLRADGTTETLKSEGSLLGIFEGETFPTVNAKLEVGDRLVVFSDGIEVAFSEDQTTDGERWRREIENRRKLSGQDLIASFIQHLDGENGSLSPKDDLTLIIAEVK